MNAIILTAMQVSLMKNGEQKPEYAIDGVHMYANRYLNVFEVVKSYLS